MRVLAALLGVVLAAIAVGLVYITSGTGPHSMRRASGEAPPTGRASSGAPLAAPLSVDEHERARYEKLRVRFFSRLQPRCASMAADCRTDDDIVTLLIETNAAEMAGALRDAAIACEPSRYGYRKIVIQERIGDDKGRRPRLVMESVLDDDGRWLTFER